MGEPERYTREEWQRIMAGETCVREGHDFQIFVLAGTGGPEKIVCTRCGLRWNAIPAGRE